MRSMCTDSNNNKQGTNSSRRLPHHHGLSAAQADDGDNLFLLSRPLGGILIIPLLPGFRSICIHTAVAALQENLQVYSVRVYFSVLDVNDVRYAVSFLLFNSAQLSHWFVFRDCVICFLLLHRCTLEKHLESVTMQRLHTYENKMHSFSAILVKGETVQSNFLLRWTSAFN